MNVKILLKLTTFSITLESLNSTERLTFEIKSLFQDLIDAWSLVRVCASIQL